MSHKKPIRTKFVDDPYINGGGYTFEDIEVAEYSNLGEKQPWYKSVFGMCGGCFGLCVTSDLQEFEMVNLSDGDSMEYELDIDHPTRKKRSSNQATDDTDEPEEGGPPIDSTREHSDDDEEDDNEKSNSATEHVPPITATPNIAVGVFDNDDDEDYSNESEENEKSSSEDNEEFFEDVDDYSSMLCATTIRERDMALFKKKIGNAIVVLKQVRSQYSISLERYKSYHEPPQKSIMDMENKIMIIDRLWQWYRTIEKKLDNFMKDVRKYPDRSKVYMTHSPSLFVEFVNKFIQEKKDTTFLQQIKPHDLPKLPDLPQLSNR